MLLLIIGCGNHSVQTGDGEDFSDLCAKGLDGVTCAQPFAGVTTFWGDDFETYTVRSERQYYCSGEMAQPVLFQLSVPFAAFLEEREDSSTHQRMFSFSRSVHLRWLPKSYTIPMVHISHGTVDWVHNVQYFIVELRLAHKHGYVWPMVACVLCVLVCESSLFFYCFFVEEMHDARKMVRARTGHGVGRL